MERETEIDARGLKCPLPVLRLRKRLGEVAAGDVVRLVATDPMAAIDVPHFCAEAGHEYLGEDAAGDAAVYRVRKGAGR